LLPYDRKILLDKLKNEVDDSLYINTTLNNKGILSILTELGCVGCLIALQYDDDDDDDDNNNNKLCRILYRD
jgi:hypothetical protein